LTPSTQSILIKFDFFALCFIGEVLLADGAGIFVLEPVEDALGVICMLTLELDSLLGDLHVVLADWADFSFLLDRLAGQSLQILLRQPL
jgi:hypothetical protein